jgi:hypothetical protein
MQAIGEAASPPLFVVGCQRSGTTWLQILLSQHAAIASAPETDVFAGYLSLLQKRWMLESDRRARHGAQTGLQDLLSEVAFHDAVGQLAAATFRAVLARKPGARIVLEKTPHNVLHVPLILALFPNARFIHVIRDPRAVLASLRAAARSWGGFWADTGAVSGALRWREHVSRGLEIPRLTPHYREIRYEALRADTAGCLHELFDWLGLAVDAPACTRFAEQGDIGKLREGRHADVAPVGNRPGFFREGKSAGWRSELSAVDIATVELELGEMMRGLGYETSLSPAGPAALAARARAAARHIIHAARWRLDGALAAIERSL